MEESKTKDYLETKERQNTPIVNQEITTDEMNLISLEMRDENQETLERIEQDI